MEQYYDVIVLGTGLTECIVSGLLSVDGKKVLQVDSNNHYGGETTSLSLAQFYKRFLPDKTPPEAFGPERLWSIDLIPKFTMGCGMFTEILYYTNVTEYLKFTSVEGSYFYKDGYIYKIPTSQREAISSPLVGLFEKKSMYSFFEYILKYEQDSPKTHKGLDLKTATTSQLYKKFNLSPNVCDLIGHGIALHYNDNHLNEPAIETYEKIILYINSFNRFGKSPYLYPSYGIGELPQGFARLGAVYGGTYMLDVNIDEILYEDDKFAGIRCGQEVAKAKICVANPNYFIDKVAKVGKVIRSICILDHPINQVGVSKSLQIIISQKEVNRNNDIYVAVVSADNDVCSKGHSIAIISTVVETDDPKSEIESAINLISPVCERVDSVYDIYVPLKDGTTDNIFITESYDATSHFESTCNEVRSLYKRITGNELNIKNKVKLYDEDQ